MRVQKMWEEVTEKVRDEYFHIIRPVRRSTPLCPQPPMMAWTCLAMTRLC
jgi:hypothetical protein